MNAENFWFGWLKIAAVIASLFGFIMAFFNDTYIFHIFNSQIDSTFHTLAECSGNIDSFRSWIVSITGAAMAGWGLTILILVIKLQEKREVWIWNALFFPLIIWFSVDTFMSLRHDANFNVIFNLVIGMQYFAPLMFLRNSLKK